jgi:hypothetical protein
LCPRLAPKPLDLGTLVSRAIDEFEQAAAAWRVEELSGRAPGHHGRQPRPRSFQAGSPTEVLDDFCLERTAATPA